ncbi:MAG: SPOR domain-containing protein [Pseudohongiellaceae bacterium]|jgi:hypothetical protein
MRTFIILLMLANLVYLGWNLLSDNLAPPVAPVPASSATAERLQLLGEVASTSPLPAATAPATEPETCIALGVFNNTEEGDFLVSALQQRGMQARVELLPAGQTRNFRVYMPPFNADTAARQTLQALRNEGLDSFLITTGELRGGISLGLFSQEELALNLQEDLAARGYATSIHEVVNTSNEIWVTIEGISQALLEGTELLDLLSQGLELEVIEKPCETIASRP